MRDLHRYRGPIYRSLMLVYNMMVLNLIFIVSSIPIITLGASLSSLYATAQTLSTDEFTGVVHEFIRNFKNTFYRGSRIFLILSLSLFTIVVLTHFTILFKVRFLTFFMLFIFSNFLLITFVIFPIGALYDGDYKLVLNNAAVFLKSDLIVSMFIFFISIIFYIMIPLFFPKLIIFHLLLGFSGMAFFQIKVIKKRLV
ncbi:DUF624 domain-containing protein [Jeotgalibaca dankookensis]|uniref:DUF624 domain-containing protein n=1 Tax=Jeotgalibaca dankookensis TaxID=708126 RepID=UPI0007808376